MLYGAVLAGVIVSLYKIFPRDVMCIILIMLIDVWSSEMCEELVEREFCSGFINRINGLILEGRCILGTRAAIDILLMTSLDNASFTHTTTSCLFIMCPIMWTYFSFTTMSMTSSIVPSAKSHLHGQDLFDPVFS